MAACRYLLSALLVAVVCATVFAHGTLDWESLKAYADGNVNFTNALYKIKFRKEGNLLFSPTIIHTMLAMTALEANSPTTEQMAKQLYLPADQKQAEDGLILYLASYYEDTTPVNTRFGIQMFPDKSVTPTDIKNGTKVLDFQHNHEEARGKINEWVEQNTEHVTVDLLPAGSVESNSSFVLVNTLYFNDEWTGSYFEKEPLREPFFDINDEAQEGSTMQQYVKVNAMYYHSEDLKADIFEIPYSAAKFTMMVILPIEKNGLKDVETRLGELPMESITSPDRRVSEFVRLLLPKFKFEDTSKLDEDLTEMGMGEMFSEQADITSDKFGPIRVPKVIHKAFIEVNDEGTKAAAGSAIGTSYAPSMNIDSSPSETHFKANHPFIFMLLKIVTTPDEFIYSRTVMLMGRYAQSNGGFDRIPLGAP